MNEFEIIENFFAKQAISRKDVILGIGDDCAVVEVPSHHQLVITTDTLIAGVHFPSSTAPFDIGFKSLAVNLSDLAAMGALPTWFTLALTLPNADVVWLRAFTEGLFTLAERFSIELIGGDLTHASLSITIQAHGLISKGQALKRSGAKPGDFIYVTETLGDAALGLQCVQKKIVTAHENYFIKRLNQPLPRILSGEKLIGTATAAIDISDGLAADLNHILTASKVGAIINVNQLPISDELRATVPIENAIAFALTGGDDYELCFTVPQNKQFSIPDAFTCIGRITAEKGLNLQYQDGSPYSKAVDGYQHF